MKNWVFLAVWLVVGLFPLTAATCRAGSLGTTLDKQMTYIYAPTTLTISGLKVTPTKGTTRTTFEIDAIYTDSNNNPPTSISFAVDGNTYFLTKNDTSSDYATGVKYSCFTKLPAGIWDFPITADSSNTSVDANLGPGEPQVLRVVVRPGPTTSTYLGELPIGCVLGINSSGNIWENVYGNWTALPGTFTAAVPADLYGTGIDNVVALDTNGDVNMYVNGAWVKNGRLTSLVVGGFNGDGTDGIAGIDSQGHIWVYRIGAWTQIPGNLERLWAGDFLGNGTDGLVGINSAGQIYYTTNLSTWTHVPGNLAGLVIGDFTGAEGTPQDGIAGLNAGGEIWYLETLSSSPSWNEVPGNLETIAAGGFLGNGTSGLGGLNSFDQIWQTANLTSWTQIPGNLESVIYGDLTGAGHDDIVGLNSSGQIWCTPDGLSWTRIPGTLSLLCGRQTMFTLK